jgi:acetyl-CoA acyltransferase
VTSDVRIISWGMTPFARTPGRGIRSLALAAIDEALGQADIPAADVTRVFVGNAAAGRVSHQEMIRGQVILRGTTLAGTPLVNVENACASGSTAAHLGWQAVASGVAEVVLVVGVEQLTHVDKNRTFAALRGSTDIEEIGEDADDPSGHSVLMDFYSAEARSYLDQTPSTVEDYARIAVKNRTHATHNPMAQYQKPQTIEDVLNAREIVPPLTLPMCSPTTDGAAALVICSAEYARRRGGPAPRILASTLASAPGDGISPLVSASHDAYEQAGFGPDQLHVCELHDAAAPAELIQYGDIGLSERGEEYRLVRDGVTELGGRLPVNTSGGLLSRGHALGATGCAQMVEILMQLTGRANGRQVEGATLGMAVNAGGWLGGTYAVGATHILQSA